MAIWAGWRLAGDGGGALVYKTQKFYGALLLEVSVVIIIQIHQYHHQYRQRQLLSLRRIFL
jgi:hypothetical protein